MAAGLSSTSAGDVVVDGATLELTPDLLGRAGKLEPLIGRLIEVPEDRALELLAGEMRAGLSVNAGFAALFSAAARGNFHHVFFGIHAASEVGRVVPAEDRALPLFWSLAYFKYWQQRQRGTRLPLPPAPPGKLPTPATAMAEFTAAMAAMDRDASERSILVLAAAQGTHAAMDAMWHYGARDWSFIGHRAIAVANSRRTLDVIGWQHAGAALRFLNSFMYRYEATGGKGESYEANLERADTGHASLPAAWQDGEGDLKATTELLQTIRRQDVEAACKLADAQLRSGVPAGPVWDAVHVAAAELMMRARDGDAVGGYPLHAVTSANGLHITFRAVAGSRERMFVLLQAVAWMTEFTRASVARKGLRELAIDTIEPVEIPADPGAAAADILATLAPGPGEQKRPPADPASHDLAAPRALAFGLRFPRSDTFMRAALRMAIRKVGTNPHDIKYPVAVFEDIQHVSPRWRPYLLAASVYRLYSSRSPDSTTFERMKASMA